MGLAVREHACKRRQVDAIGLEVERLNAGDGFPQERIDTPGVNPGIYRSDAGGPAIDGDLCFAETGAATALQGTREVTRHAQVPELVVRLTLGNNVEVDGFDIHGQCEALAQLVIDRESIRLNSS